MIKVLKLLRNVGQFDSVAATQFPLERFTLVYAENGRGKTTLSAILRSLGTNRAELISERHRLAAPNPPEIIIDCSGGQSPAIFRNGTWSRTLPELAIFDDAFVDENIHSGLSVEAGHRKNLHELIIGAQGVALNQELQELVTKIEVHTAEIRMRALVLPAASVIGMTQDAFCALQPNPEIDREIQEAERALQAAREQAPIKEAQLFDSLALPAFDIERIQGTLQRDLPALEAAAAARVQVHLSRLPPGSEAWVADGMRRLPTTGNECPFCAQDLNGSPVLSHYQAFFSKEYRTLKDEIKTHAENTAKLHSDSTLVQFERALRTAGERVAFWSRFADMPKLDVDTSTLDQAWKYARDLVAAAFAAKAAAPLDMISLSQETLDAISAYETHCAGINDLSGQLLEANRTINLVKERSAAGNVMDREADIVRLRAVKTRHEPEVAQRCNAYLEEKAAKAATEQLRTHARDALTNYRDAIFPNYQNSINEYLSRFHAGFRLEQITPANTRAGSACTYSLRINNVAVPVTTEATPGAHSFRNTLSAGDRNTLALAFFFASLDQDPNLANKIVVIDDPVSSLDDSRSLATVQEIRRLMPRVSQIIVLSHSKPFLCQTWKSSTSAQRAAIHVRRDGPSSSTVDGWDVDMDLVTEYDQRHEKLRNYLAARHNGNLREIALDIRPVLEYFCRVAYPADYPPGEKLGVFRDRCLSRLTQNLIMPSADVQELRDLTDYANRFHHDSNPKEYLVVTLTDTELQGFVGRTLRFCSRQ